MASGPWHYSEAERLIDEANHVGHRDAQRADGMIAAAHVHATLSLAAATALLAPVAAGDEPGNDPDYSAWIEVACETTQNLATDVDGGE